MAGKRIFSGYQAVLERHPLATKCAMSGTLFAFGDIISQVMCDVHMMRTSRDWWRPERHKKDGDCSTTAREITRSRSVSLKWK